MSNFRIKKQVKVNSNMKDSNTLEIKHRCKIKQIETKRFFNLKCEFSRY